MEERKRACRQSCSVTFSFHRFFVIPFMDKFPSNPLQSWTFACWNTVHVWEESVFCCPPRSPGGLAMLGRGSSETPCPLVPPVSFISRVPAERLLSIKGCQSFAQRPTFSWPLPMSFDVDQYNSRTVTGCDLLAMCSAVETSPAHTGSPMG